MISILMSCLTPHALSTHYCVAKLLGNNLVKFLVYLINPKSAQMATHRLSFLTCAMLLLATAMPLNAQEDAKKAERQAERREQLRELDRDTQIIKERTLDLEHALYLLETDQQMHPLSETRLFFQVPTRNFYRVEKLQLLLDGKSLVDINYLDTEAAALHKQGADRVFHGNISPGEHELTAIVSGQFEADDKTLRHDMTASFSLDKTRGLTHLLIDVDDSKTTWEPKLRMQAWQ